jgi:hypothetical protein
LHETDATSAAVVYSLENSGHTVVQAKPFGEASAILKSLRKSDLGISDIFWEHGGNVFDFLR